MAAAGDVLKAKGSSIEFIETSADSGGERVVVEIAYAGTGGRPPAHMHPNQTEHFEVLEGEIEALVGGERRTLRSGDELTIPPGTVHEMWTDAPARKRWTTSPALRTERFFETVWGLQRDARTDGTGVPSKPQMALTLRHFAAEFLLVSPPPPVQAVVFPLLATVAKLRGAEPEYTP